MFNGYGFHYMDWTVFIFNFIEYDTTEWVTRVSDKMALKNLIKTGTDKEDTLEHG